MVDAIVAQLQARGVAVRLWTQNSNDIGATLRPRAKAFVSGVYSFAAARTMLEVLRTEKPDIVHVHNLLPLFSPSVLLSCKRAHVPVVMTCHNYRLICPTGKFDRNGQICERCAGGREYWCALTNCRRDVLQSIGYALRNAVHRRYRLYLDNVALFLAISNCVRERLIEAGIPQEQVRVLPNMVSIPDSAAHPATGQYIGFVGRVVPHKGVDTLLEAAALTGLPTRVAGDCTFMPQARKAAPKGVVFTGVLRGDEVAQFYREARCIVVPSKCREGFGLVAAEAMSHGVPVIASRIGALPKIVEDGVTGLLFEPGNVGGLAEMMVRIWEDSELCQRLGAAARQKAVREYAPETYCQNLLSAYREALRFSSSRTMFNHGTA